MAHKDTPHTNPTEPFLVLVDPPKQDPFRPPIYDLRFVNPTSSTLEDVCTDTGGFYSDADSGVVQATGKKHEFGNVEPGCSVSIEEPDVDELYEFVIWWNVSYGIPPRTLRFSLFKNRDAVPINPVPVLGGEGILIPRC